ncbi:MAG: phosphoribosylglycinamide formyltransferase [Roseobacter sp.]
MTKKVAIFISGSGSNMATLLDSMHGDHPAHACVVLSNNPKAAGLEKAEARGIPTEIVRHQPFHGDTSAFEHAILGALTPHAPDIICLAGFMRILSADFVDPWQGRMLNIHPSLLPKYKGLHTHRRALDAGDAEHGCSVHEVTPRMDDGPILGQATVPILPEDTEESLAARVLAQEHILYPKVLHRFVAGTRAPLFLRG